MKKPISKMLLLLLSVGLLSACLDSNVAKNNEPKDDNGTPTENEDNPNYNPENPENPDNPNNPETPTNTDNVLSISVEDLATGYGWENATQYRSFKLDSVVTVSVSEGTNTGKYYESDSTYRLYAAENATLTISVSEGHELKSVAIAYNVKDNGAIENLKSGEAVEVTGDSVTFTAISETGTKGKVLITDFTVTYTGTAGTDPFVREDWNESELALFKEYIYGVDVPFIYFPGIKATYDQYYGLYIEVPLVQLADCVAFIDAFEAAENWVNTEESKALNDGFYLTEVVNAQNERRFVSANIYLIDDEGYLLLDEEAYGTLYIDLKDPYYYKWDADMIAEVIEYCGIKTEAVLPAIEVNYMSVQYYEDEFFVAIGLYEKTEADYTAYKALFASWNVEEASEYVGFDAIAPTEDLLVSVYYEDGEIDIFIQKYLKPLDQFPTQDILDFNGNIEIPAVEGASYFTKEIVMTWIIDWDAFELVETPDNLEIMAYGVDAAEMTAYLNTLEENFDIELVLHYDEYENLIEDEAGYYVTYIRESDGLYYAYSMEYNLTSEELRINVALPSSSYASATWMGEAVQTNFLTPNNLTVEIPTFAVKQGDLFIYEYDEDGFFVYAFGDYESEWCQVLSTAGWTVPTKPDEEWGYECLDPTSAVEIDVNYVAESGVTYLSIYDYAALMAD